jgi:hypothetical protein
VPDNQISPIAGRLSSNNGDHVAVDADLGAKSRQTF